MILRKVVCVSILMIYSITCFTKEVCFELDLETTTEDNQLIELQILSFKDGNPFKITSKYLPLNKNYKDVIELPQNIKEGIFLLSINNQNYFEIILTYDEMPTLKGSIQDLIDGNILINNSNENEAYYKMLSASQILDKQAANLRDERLTYKSIDAKYYTKQRNIELKLFNAQKEYNNELQKIESVSPNLFVTNFIIPIAKLPIPTKSQLNFYETNEAFLHDFYLDNLQLNSSLYKDLYWLKNSLKIYLEKYTPVREEYHKKSIDKILNKAKNNPEMTKYLADFLMHFYYQERRDELVIYTYNLYTSNYCSTASDDLNVEDIIQNLQLNQVGNKVKELNLPNEKNKLVSLKQVIAQNRVTILLFWSADCATCMEEIPKLKVMYEKYKTRGLAVYAVNLDKEKSKWLNVVSQFNLDWYNLNELKPRNQSQVEQLYKVRITPTIYVIDDEARIAAKDLFGFELEASLVAYINKNGIFD